MNISDDLENEPDNEPEEWIPFEEYKKKGYGIYADKNKQQRRMRKRLLIPGKERQARMEILTGIPIPERKPGRKGKYPFSTISIGDSVRFETMPDFRKGVNAASQHALRKGLKFTSRWYAKEGYGLIWRVE